MDENDRGVFQMKITYDNDMNTISKVKFCCYDMSLSILTIKNIDINECVVYIIPLHQHINDHRINLNFCPYCGAEVKVKEIHEF